MIYGVVLGCFIHKIIFYYLNFIIINNYNNEYIDIYDIMYYISYLLFVIPLGIINIFFPDKFAFLPCSTLSGSFYIINNLYFIITKKKDIEVIITSIIIQIIIIIFSFFYQIFHIKYKESEEKNNYKIENLHIRNSGINSEIIASKSNQDNAKEQSLLYNDKHNKNDNNEEEEIDDQED